MKNYLPFLCFSPCLLLMRRPPAGSTPMSALTMPIPTPVTAIIPTRLSKTKPILTSCPPASKFCPDWRSKASISSLPMKNTSANVILPGDSLKTDMSLRAYGVDVVNDFLNLGLVEILGSVGIARYDVKVSQDYFVNGTGGHTNKTYSGEGLRFGIGAQINLTDSWSLRGMGRYSVTNIEKIDDFKEITLGLRYSF